MSKKVVPTILMAVLFAAVANAGTVRGTVTDADTGDSIEGVKVCFLRKSSVDFRGVTPVSDELNFRTNNQGVYTGVVPGFFPGTDEIYIYTSDGRFTNVIYESATFAALDPTPAELQQDGATLQDAKSGNLNGIDFRLKKRESGPLQDGGIFEMIEMSDGVRLATDVYLAEGGSEKKPAVLVRTPYGRRAMGMDQQGRNYSAAGYNCVIQDTRGRFDSEGSEDVFHNDGWSGDTDGRDTCDWIRAQPWSDGQIVGVGGSALSVMQYMLAGSNPEGLRAQALPVGASDLYEDIVYPGGVRRKSLVENWLAGGSFNPRTIELMREHWTDDDYWRNSDAAEQVANVSCAGVHIGGWFDIFNHGTVRAWKTRQFEGGVGARGEQWLMMGPWTHGAGLPKAGDLMFPMNAAGIQAPWADNVGFFNHYTRGLPNPLANTPHVAYYQMGAVGERGAPGNEWKSADAWPPAESKDVSFFLSPGSLSTSRPDGTDVRYTYDPRDPTPSLGGANLTIEAGSKDQRQNERREDNVLFDYVVSGEPLVIAGNVRAELFVSSSATDTDFMVRMTDVYPDGSSMLMLDAARAAKFIDGDFKNPRPLEAGEVRRITVDLTNIALTVNVGHKLRITITSSNYPRFEKNLNNWPAGGNPVIARNVIHTGGDHASRLILPLVGFGQVAEEEDF
ncbi:MAG: CocE/NonD family hydrolase [Planctomycetes bacterium]|nr:CocE/NonD family hydrolase [Planctomycetota bacterium]